MPSHSVIHLKIMWATARPTSKASLWFRMSLKIKLDYL